MSILEKLVKIVSASFESVTGRESFQNALTRNELVIADLILVILYIVVVFMFGKYLWNSVACPHITFMKPLSSAWQLLGISLLLQLFF
jgi:hypothetical protein